MPGEWLANNEYTSPATVNEIIALMGQNILRGMLEEIRANLLMKLLMFLTMSKLAYQFDGLILIMLFMKTHSALSNWKTLKLQHCLLLLKISWFDALYLSPFVGDKHSIDKATWAGFAMEYKHSWKRNQVKLSLLYIHVFNKPSKQCFLLQIATHWVSAEYTD